MLSVIILAAGQGTRMKSKLPKVLHPLGGKPLLAHLIATVSAFSSDIHVIYGHQGDQIRNALGDLPVHWIFQKEQLGTGHAVLQALPEIADDHLVLVLMGDCPLLSNETLQAFYQQITQKTPSLGLMIAKLENPTGYGRIIYNTQGQFSAIIEEKDANSSEKEIKLINAGIYLVPARFLKAWLPQLSNHNQQNEYLLTDIVKRAHQEGLQFETFQVKEAFEVLGINDRQQLAEAERHYQRQIVQKLMQNGVTFRDPQRVDVRGEITIDNDVTVDVNVIFEGVVQIKSGCVIGANSILKDVVLHENVTVHPHSIIEGAVLANHCQVGPFARIRPGSQLREGARVGNFVEMKKSILGEGSKANHLTYLGDAVIGKKVNIGAGTITCNYDGVHKYPTVIKDDVFIGSNTSLVAPVNIEEGAIIGAGSTITHNAPPQQLTLARAKQVTVEKWKRKK